MQNAQISFNLQDLQENNYFLNNIFNFNTTTNNDQDDHSEGKKQFGGELFDMEWLDNIDLKEEQEEEAQSSEKDTERKRKHNEVEKARRLFIDAKIRELGSLLPGRNEMFHEVAKDIKYNKGGILRAAVSYVKVLKLDQIKKRQLEDRYQTQAQETRRLMAKFQEYQRDMMSYGLPVKHTPEEFFTFSDGSSSPISYSENQRNFEQLNIDEDECVPMSRKDPMFSSFVSNVSPASSISSRGSSVESVDEDDSLPVAKVMKKMKSHYTRRRQSSVQSLELANQTRIPVVSRPYLSRTRDVSSCPIVFPLPQGLSQLGEMDTHRKPLQTRVSLETMVGHSNDDMSGSRVIRLNPSVVRNKAEVVEEEAASRRKVILQGRC